MKLCSTCKESKALEMFVKGRNMCRVCSRKASASWYAKNPEKKRQYALSRPNRTEYNRKQNLKTKYGLTERAYQDMFAAQGGVCAVCSLPETAIDKRTNKTMPLAVDHNHMNNAIRGLLCASCNGGLGLFKDNKASLQAAIKYLESSSCA